MKRSAIVVALALGLMAQGAMAKTLNVVSSFSVLGDIAQQVGGEHVHVDTLVGPDGDPHTFEPSPKDSALLSKADVVVVNGLGLEGWLDRLIKASGFKGELVVAPAAPEKAHAAAQAAAGDSPAARRCRTPR